MREKVYTNAKIDNIVEQFLKEHNITKPPVNVFKIASDMGFDLFSASFTDPKIAGMMAIGANPNQNKLHSGKLIAVNERGYNTRDIFTVAHELGHATLHYKEGEAFFERYLLDNNSVNITQDQPNEMEQEADYFAASLLMPVSFMQRFIDNSIYRNDREKLRQSIMNTFYVSFKAADRRLDELGITF